MGRGCGRSNCGAGLGGAWHGSHRWRFALRSPAKANRGQPLHQRHAPLFGMIVVEFTALRPNFVLRGSGNSSIRGIRGVRA